MMEIPQGVVVGLGDSMTLKQIGLIPILERGDYRLLNSWAEPNMEKRILMQRQILTSDAFLVGTNAITLSGELINVDGLSSNIFRSGPPFIRLSRFLIKLISIVSKQTSLQVLRATYVRYYFPEQQSEKFEAN